MTPLAEDLRRYLIDHLHSYTPAERAASHWVMSGEWLAECIRAEYPEVFAMTAGTHLSTGPVYLLGLPVVVREDAGAPCLEPG